MRILYCAGLASCQRRPSRCANQPPPLYIPIQYLGIHLGFGNVMPAGCSLSKVPQPEDLYHSRLSRNRFAATFCFLGGGGRLDDMMMGIRSRMASMYDRPCIALLQYTMNTCSGTLKASRTMPRISAGSQPLPPPAGIGRRLGTDGRENPGG